MKTTIKILLVLILTVSLYADIKPAMTSFNAGEISPLLLLRSDFAKYDNSCQTLQNFLPLSQGPVVRRPGTYYIASTKIATQTVRLIPFEYAKTDSYILEFGDEYIRFYRNGGQIVDSVATETITVNNIVAHYLLNDIEGTVVVDADGGTYPGTATGNVSLWTDEGKAGSCLDFGNTYAVEIDDNANFSFGNAATDTAFSIAGWVYVNGIDSLQVIASKWQEDTLREWRLSLDDSQHLQLHLCDDSIGLTSDRLAQWYLNEATNTTHVDDVSTTYDGIASANTDTFDATGKISGGLDFGGDKYVTVADAAGLSFGNAATDTTFSISAWIYVTESNHYQYIMSKLNHGSAIEWSFYLSGSERLSMYLADDSAAAYIHAYTSPLTNGWHHVVGSYDATEANTGITLYVDGESQTVTRSSQGTYVAMENTATDVLMGAVFINSSRTNFFESIIDNIILFDIELTTADVLNLYNSGEGTESLSMTFPSTVADDALGLGWHFVASTYTGVGSGTAADGILLYVEGSLVDSTSNNTTDYVAMENTAVKTRIGAQYSSASALEYIWRDKIDNIFIVSDVLTAVEIAALYTTAAYEIVSPYTESQLFDIQYAQSADVMYLAHKDELPRKLTRTLHTLWTIEDVNYVTGPFMNQNTASTTLTPSGLTGTIDITASEDVFNSSQVGALWEIRHPRTDATLSGSLATATSTSAIDCEGEYKLVTHGTWTAEVYLERSNDNGLTWEKVSGSFVSSVNDDNIDLSDEETESGYKYRVTMANRSSGTATYTFVVYDHIHTGIVKITNFTSPTVVTAKVYTALSAASSTTYWSEGYWSDYNGYPETIEFHEFRLWYGGNNNYPQTLWASRIDDYNDMTAGDLDTDALIYTIPNQNPIQWLKSQTYLMIGSLGGAGRIGEQDEAMAPLVQPQYLHQTTDGCKFLQAEMAGDAILYVERGGKKVREFVYNFEKDKFVSPDMTVLAEHITGDGIDEMAYQSRPDSTLWCVRDDGDFLSMTYNRPQDVVAWAHHVTDGDIESVATIPGTGEDEVWMSVERTIDGSTVRYIERMQPRDWGTSQSDCFFVDSGLTWNGGDTVSVGTATQASPCVIHVSSWPVDGDGTSLADGDQIIIQSVLGMTELNGNVYTMDDAVVASLTFSLNNSSDTANISAASYTTYISGGTVQRVDNTFSGFDHLEGESISVLADGDVQANVTVATGTISIDVWANKVHAGMPYTSILETMPVAVEGAIGARIQISRVAVNFYESLGTLYGVEDDTEECFTETSLVTGWKKLSFQQGYTDEATIYLEQIDPLPLTIRAIIPSVIITEQ